MNEGMLTVSASQIQIDELTKYYGMKPTDYEAVRCGMNVSKAIIEGSIDAGIGLENVQMVELEEWLAGQGRPRSDVQMLRIDELAELGCCCFCSILYIGVFLPSAFACHQLITR
jgi:pyrimidine precursor biosynthesis enzyme